MSPHYSPAELADALGLALALRWRRAVSWFRHADLKIAVATAKSGYTDWRIVHVERGPFANEMLADTHQLQRDGTLSVMVQETADHHVPSRLRIVEFRIRK